MWIFVLRPPRERPIASSSLPPFWRRRHVGAPAQWWSRRSGIRNPGLHAKPRKHASKHLSWPIGESAGTRCSSCQIREADHAKALQPALAKAPPRQTTDCSRRAVLGPPPYLKEAARCAALRLRQYQSNQDRRLPSCDLRITFASRRGIPVCQRALAHDPAKLQTFRIRSCAKSTRSRRRAQSATGAQNIIEREAIQPERIPLLSRTHQERYQSAQQKFFERSGDRDTPVFACGRRLYIQIAASLLIPIVALQLLQGLMPIIEIGPAAQACAPARPVNKG